MQWFVVCALAAMAHGGGVTKTSGIEQFWTDDYKIFEQVYGKTSDKDLYRATYSSNPPKTEPVDSAPKASNKKEYVLSFKDEDDYDSYITGDKFNQLLTNKALKPHKTKQLSFIGSNKFKPISLTSDPETYNYLKHLERISKDKSADYPTTYNGGFKPLYSVGPNPEETDAFKSIQDILDAHEANKGDDDDEDSNYSQTEEVTKKPKRFKATKPARKTSKPLCLPGMCRKRSTFSYRIRANRPIVRRIKQYIVYK